jgi:hypothetical protein
MMLQAMSLLLLNSMNDDDEIRAPDSARMDQLLPSSSDYSTSSLHTHSLTEDQQLQQVLSDSLADWTQQEIQKMNQFTQKKKDERTTSTEEIRRQLNRIGKFDANVNEVALIIAPILEDYCQCKCDVHVISDVDTYMHIFKVLASIRLHPLSISLMESILSLE